MKHSLLILVLLMAILALSSGYTMGVASASSSPPMYASVYSTSPNAPNITVAIPLDSNNVSILPDVTVVIYGTGTYNVSLDNATVRTGYSVNEAYVNFTVGMSRSHEMSIRLNGAVVATMTNLHPQPVATFLEFQSVYLTSTFPGQAQILYAPPVTGNATGVPDLMYPYWNFTMFSTVPVNYAVYVNGAFVSSGTLFGEKSIHVYVNSTVGTATVGIGNVLYKFPDLPVSTVPLRVRYSTPAPQPIYTAGFLALFKVQVLAGVAIIMVGIALIVAPITATKKERMVR